MTTWSGHTTNADRHLFYLPCLSCGRKRRISLSTVIADWLDGHPDESLTVRDASIKWNVSAKTADSAIRRASRAGRIRRSESDGVSEWVGAKGTE